MTPQSEQREEFRVVYDRRDEIGNWELTILEPQIVQAYCGVKNLLMVLGTPNHVRNIRIERRTVTTTAWEEVKEQSKCT